MASDRAGISVWIRCAIGGFVSLRIAIGEIDCDFLGPGIEHNAIDSEFGWRGLVLLGYCGRNAGAPGRQDKSGKQQQEKSRFEKNINDRKKNRTVHVWGISWRAGTIEIRKLERRCKRKRIEHPWPNKSTGASML